MLVRFQGDSVLDNKPREIKLEPYTSLCGADFAYARFECGTDLSHADLSTANLFYADMRGVNLESACLDGACITLAAFPAGFFIARLDLGGWPVTVYPTHTVIGCQDHPNAKWLKWTPAQVRHMAYGAQKWWTTHRAVVCAAIRDVQRQDRAYKAARKKAKR